MIAIKRLAAAAALFATLAGPAQAADPTERSEIESIVREYLLANPELLLEMQGALQAKQAQEAKERAQRVPLLVAITLAIFMVPAAFIGVLGSSVVQAIRTLRALGL